MPGNVRRPFIEPTLTIRPQPGTHIAGSTKLRHIRIIPNRLVSNIACTRSSGRVSTAPS